MRRWLWLRVAWAACCASGPAICAGAAPVSQPAAGSQPPATSRPAGAVNVEAEIARLSAVVLADPVNSAAQGELLELRRREERQRGDALNGLIEALQAHLLEQSGRTAPGLVRAKRSRYVVSLVNHELAPVHLSLDALLIQARPGAVCDKCGGTMLADCPRCRGAGVIRCLTCRGKGLVVHPAAGEPGARRRRPRRDAPTAPGGPEPCKACGQTGAGPCSVCGGAGTVPCTDCGKAGGPDGGARSAEAAAVRRALRKLIAVSTYLRDGGLDLYSPGVLRCSPRLPQ